MKACMIWILCVAAMSSNAQGTGIGDTISDAAMPVVFNYKNGSASLSEFKGKPMIIHFWNTHCPVSREMLVTLKQVQQEYGDALTILAVTNDKKEKVEELMRQLPYARELKFPIVVNDTTLRKLFPYRQQPHEVWVGKTGVVKAISSYEYLTAGQVRNFMSSDRFQLPLKEDPMDINTASDEPLIGMLHTKYPGYINKYSFFGNEIRGMGGSTSYSRIKNGIARIRVINNTLYSMYGLAYMHGEVHRKRVFIKTADIAGHQWETKAFCFELLVRTDAAKKAYDVMKKELDAYFGIRSRLEKRRIQCFVLKIGDKQKIKPGIDGSTYYTDSGMVIPNIPPALFAKNILFTLPLPVVDETGYSGRIFLELPLNYKEVPALRRWLMKYGLTLEEKEREMEVIILD